VTGAPQPFEWSAAAVEIAAYELCRQTICRGPDCRCWNGHRDYARQFLDRVLAAEREAVRGAVEAGKLGI
jgi:hypothetical protein